MTDGDGVAGCRIELRRTPRRARTAATDSLPTDLPTLGEIIDKLRAEYADYAWPCDPALRDVRIGSVAVQGR